MFADFIKHYDNIRSILREIFLYGCFSREDYENKKIGSSRKVSYEMRRIQQYIAKDFIKSDRDGKTKLLSLSYDSITNTKNFLVGTYLNKSFTRTDLILYYYILLAINSSEKYLSINEIEDFLIDNNLINCDEISRKTIERKVKELCETMELIFVCKRGRCKVYGISKDILEELNEDEISKLELMTSLYKNILFPNIAGYYFEDTLKQYMEFERNIKVDDKDIFQYQKLHFHPIVEEEILWKLLKAIEEKRKIILKYNKNNKTARYSEERIIPYKIRYDVDCGRFYLVGFCEGRCLVSRLDRIDSIKVLGEHFNSEGLEEKYKFSMENSWSAVHINGETKPEVLRFRVTIKDESENYLIERIKAELKSFDLEKEDNYTFVFSKIVNDCNEMTPWIRGYGGRLDIIEPNYIKRKIKKDWKEMLENYGVIS